LSGRGPVPSRGSAGEVLRLTLAHERDVFVARQRGREVAAAVGLENQDQVRVATALSELGRELVVRGRRAEVVLALQGGGAPALELTVSWGGEIVRVERTEGVVAAMRLADHCEVVQGDGRGSVLLTKRLPATVAAPTPARVRQLREQFRRSTAGSELDELRAQNQELLRTLESLQARQEDLEAANAELEETNQGVLALHAELSGELEETNRGVVALYAELDEKSIQLREASESKTRFWSGVSHELRTPINSVIGLARLLLDPGSEPLAEEQQVQVSMIRDSGTLLLALVNELLDVAKAESGRLEPRPEPVDLDALVQHLVAVLAPLVPGPAVRLVAEVDRRTPLLLTDPAMLTAILRNLATNALKFTERGEVRLEAHLDGDDAVVVRVGDTGIGIPPEHLGRVFEEFHQVPGRLQVRAQGTGLGLPYARRLAGLLGGSLTLESRIDVGTTATLRLPITQESGEVTALGRVLVVDDDPTFRALARRMLGESARQIVEAADGATALRLLRDDPPDLLLLDLNIPPPDGRAVLAAVRTEPDLAAVPVVVITAAEVDTADGDMNAAAVVLQKSNLQPGLLAAAAAAAKRLVRDKP
jgi:signal transduction histidine kinase/CheY-like chemotaxis protein